MEGELFEKDIRERASAVADCMMQCEIAHGYGLRAVAHNLNQKLTGFPLVECVYKIRNRRDGRWATSMTNYFAPINKPGHMWVQKNLALRRLREFRDSAVMLAEMGSELDNSSHRPSDIELVEFGLIECRVYPELSLPGIGLEDG